MIFGVVLAGGIGSRMAAEKPKQYINIGGKPIIVHTIEKFIQCDKFEAVLVLCPEEWQEYTKELCREYLDEGSYNKVCVIKGGAVRNETIMNSIRFINDNYGLNDDTIIVTHDAVRPFVTERIIEDNIKAVMKYGACDTVIPATDTIVEVADNRIASIPNRANLRMGQTPQTFKAKELKETYEALTSEEKYILTDACKIYALKGKHVHLVEGEVFNIKITYPYDLIVAEALLKGEKLNA